jgi:hypothetical protein
MRWLGLLLLGLGALGAQDLPPAVRAEIARPETLPAGRWRELKRWSPLTTGSRQTGHRVADLEAAGGAAWEATVGQDVADRPMSYGPYLDVPAGVYVALFRLRLNAAVEDDVVGRVDACVQFGQEILTSREVWASDLAPGRYRLVPLAFRCAGPKLECRVFWNAYADLRLDEIVLYAVEGAKPTDPGRVPQPRLTGQPRDLPYPPARKAAADLFPRSKAPAPTLTVCDLRTQPSDVRAMVLALQGLVNREQPRLYCLLHAIDERWLEVLRERGYVQRTVVEPTVDELVRRWRGLVKGLAIVDPRLPATRNVATMLAGVEDRLPVSPRLAKVWAELGPATDLRGRWRTTVEAYRWAFDTLWPRLSHDVIACLWPDQNNGLRDYLVQHRVFTFWLSGQIDGARPGADAQGEVRLLEELLAKMPVNMPVLGYPWAGKDIGIGEHDGVQLFAQFGKYLVGSVDVTNLSVHTGVPVPKLTQPRPPAPALADDKVYVCWLMSDGDNLPVLSLGNFPELWAQPDRGKLPLAWTISPSAPLLMPAIVEDYYRRATPHDVFVGAVSGIGYTYPEDYAERFGDQRAQVFDDFLRQTAEGSRALDLRQHWMMGLRDPSVLARYAELIPEADGLLPDYGRVARRPEDAFYPTSRGVPVFRAANGWLEHGTREEKIALTVAQLREFTPPERPAFVHAFVWNWGADLGWLAEAQRRLGPDYVAVRPDHFAALGRQALDRRQVVLRASDGVPMLSGRPFSLGARVQNVGRETLSLSVGLTGLDEAQVTPPRMTLAPNAEAELRATGRPTSDQVTWVVSGAFGARRRTVGVARLAPEELRGALPAGPLAFVDRFEAAGLAHRSGAAATQAGSLATQVWLAKAGETEPGHIVFGPYTPLPAGRYVALFRLRRTGEGTGPLARLDAALGGGQELRRVDLQVADLARDAWQAVPLAFDHPGGALETRVFWNGSATLAVDSIILWRQ